MTFSSKLGALVAGFVLLIGLSGCGCCNKKGDLSHSNSVNAAPAVANATETPAITKYGEFRGPEPASFVTVERAPIAPTSEEPLAAIVPLPGSSSENAEVVELIPAEKPAATQERIDFVDPALAVEKAQFASVRTPAPEGTLDPVEETPYAAVVSLPGASSQPVQEQPALRTVTENWDHLSPAVKAEILKLINSGKK